MDHKPVNLPMHRAIKLKEKRFRAHWWGWRRVGLGPDESHTRPDRVNGSLVKSVLGRGTWGVLTYQPLQTCLSVHRRPCLWLGRPESGSQGACWLESALWAVSWGEGDIEFISHVDRGRRVGEGVPRVQEETQCRAKLWGATGLALSRVTPWARFITHRFPFLFLIALNDGW